MLTFSLVAVYPLSRSCAALALCSRCIAVIWYTQTFLLTLHGDHRYQGQVRNYPTSLNQFLASKTSYDKTRDEDPREAILKHADAARENPQFVDKAYTMMNNRVDPIFNTEYVPVLLGGWVGEERGGDLACSAVVNTYTVSAKRSYDSDEDEQAQGSLHKKPKFDPMKKPFQIKDRSAKDMA